MLALVQVLWLSVYDSRLYVPLLLRLVALGGGHQTSHIHLIHHKIPSHILNNALRAVNHQTILVNVVLMALILYTAPVCRVPRIQFSVLSDALLDCWRVLYKMVMVMVVGSFEKIVRD